jgi:hypothetical protein
MARFAHLTDAQYRALQCQVLSAEYTARAMNLRNTRWNDDAIEAQEWAAHYAERARRLMNVEVL